MLPVNLRVLACAREAFGRISLFADLTIGVSLFSPHPDPLPRGEVRIGGSTAPLMGVLPLNARSSAESIPISTPEHRPALDLANGSPSPQGRGRG